MLLFEYDSGHLYAARLGARRSEDVDPGVMAAVRDSALEIVGRPLFPVRWQGSDGARAAASEPHRLVAMDPSGQVVSLEVLGALDSVNLVAALARSGRTAGLGWMALADLYPQGVDAFRHDWAAFRESLPPRPIPGPRLYVITGLIHDDVRPSLEMLADSGVEVYEVHQRESSDGRIFVEITEPFRVTVPTVGSLAGAHAEQRAELVGDEQVQRLISPEQAIVDDEGQVGTEASPEAGEPPVVVEEPDAAGDPAPEGYEDGVVPDQGLVEIAREIGEPTPLVWIQHRKGVRTEVTLRADGLIELADGRRFSDPSQAAVVAAERHEADGWRVWRITEGGPTLAEAREELARLA